MKNLFNLNKLNHNISLNDNGSIKSIDVTVNSISINGWLMFTLTPAEKGADIEIRLIQGNEIHKVNYNIFDESLEAKDKFLGILEEAGVDHHGQLVMQDAILAALQKLIEGSNLQLLAQWNEQAARLLEEVGVQPITIEEARISLAKLADQHKKEHKMRTLFNFSKTNHVLNKRDNGHVYSIDVYMNSISTSGWLEFTIEAVNNTADIEIRLTRGNDVKRVKYNMFDESIETKDKFLGILEDAGVNARGILMMSDAILAAYEKLIHYSNLPLIAKWREVSEAKAKEVGIEPLSIADARAELAKAAGIATNISPALAERLGLAA